MIYLDNAATTMRKPDCVVEAVTRALTTMGNASRGSHGEALAASRVDFACRQQLAHLFGCPRPDHVAFASNSTEALNVALMGTLRPGDHVITTVTEHNSVLRPLYRLQAEREVELSFVGIDELGRVRLEEFERLVRPNTRAIVCTHASNVTGNLLDLAPVGRVARKHGLLLIVDASQTAGVIPIDMDALGIDILCFTGHKGLMGPQGTGGLCVREGVEIEPLKVGGTGVQSYSKTQPREYPTRLEAGTLNSHGLAGLSAALDFLEEVGPDTIAHHERALAESFYEGVRAIEGVRVYGDIVLPDHGPRCAVVALNVGDYESGEVSDALAQDYDIATRPGAHCAPLMHEALGTVEQGIVRFSFSWFNSSDEVEAAVQAVAEIAG